MGNKSVTIVVPVYNTERYLDRCVKSIVNQTYSDLEIILVDDCSPDRCPQMCDEWAKRDSRVRVIHKEKNEGQGFGRNSALDIATGDYICFFDSDDYIIPETVEILVHAIEAECADMAIFGMKRIAADGSEISAYVPQFAERTYRGDSVQHEFLPIYISPDPAGKFFMSACLAMYSVGVLRSLNWHFVSERQIISEDVYSLLDLLSGVDCVTVVSQALYCCYENDVSFSRSYRRNRYERIRHFYESVIELGRRKGYSEEVLYKLSKPYLGYTIATLKQEAKSPLPLAERLNNVRSILHDPVLQRVLHQNRSDYIGLKQRVVCFCMKTKCLYLCFLLFRIKQ